MFKDMSSKGDDGLAKAEFKGIELFDESITRLRFSLDLRIREVQRLLQATDPVRLEVADARTLSDHDLLVAQQKRLGEMAQRTLALAVGRGMFAMASHPFNPVDMFPIPRTNLTGKMPGNPALVQFDPVSLSWPVDALQWPDFHNGAAAGFWLLSSEQNPIDSSWVLFNRPETTTDCTHGGFLLALGMGGHLSCLNQMSIYQYLTLGDPLTSIGLLLGLTAAKRGTMDSGLTKILGIHLPCLLPSADLETPHLLQAVALIGVGLLYQGTAHRRMAELMLQEIGRASFGSELDSQSRDAYCLSAGLALGFITLGQGRSAAGLADLHIEGRLANLVYGKTTAGSSPVNVIATAPAALMALGLLFLKSNDRAAAAIVELPVSRAQLDAIQPDSLCLRLLTRSLILWQAVEPTEAWLRAQIPSCLYQAGFNRTKESNGRSSHEPAAASDPAGYRAYCSILVGACLSVGFRFAGTFSKTAFDLLLSKLDWFIERLSSVPARLQHVTEHSAGLVMLALSAIMAGSGNLELMRRIRRMHGRTSGDGLYGVHMAYHMAMGLLFLGAGRCTLSRSKPALAALLCALYPRFPLTTNDNRYHLQALRHFWILATQNRCLVSRDVQTGELQSVQVDVVFRDGAKSLGLTTPALLPEFELIERIQVRTARYWELDISPANLVMRRGACCIYVKRKLGYLSYSKVRFY